MKASQEFVVGKHNIGWINVTFTESFKDQEFEQKASPTFQKLPRPMNDAAIESELKPGLCELGDILAFLQNPPEGSKDGYANLFYTPSFVVVVRWDGGGWYVSAWVRDDDGWLGGRRVFSPETNTQALGTGSLVPFEPLTPNIASASLTRGMDMKITTVFKFAIKVGEREYNFNVEAISPDQAKGILYEELGNIRHQLSRAG